MNYLYNCANIDAAGPSKPVPKDKLHLKFYNDNDNYKQKGEKLTKINKV